jgi:decaprenylphospho-beta-D-ribofuranose 2-oxidase
VIWKEAELSGWGRTSTARVSLARPERISAVVDLVRQPLAGGLLAFGQGRSYGDVALNDGGHQLLTERLNRLLDFDEASGELVVEPGVTFADINRVFLPRGWLVPVSPGTAFATIGGAVANDVHGKNHEVAGSFGEYVLWLDLLLPSGEIVRASPLERAELFAATIGGIGLTGVILAVALRMNRVPSNAVEVTQRRMPDLEALLAAFAESNAPYSVGWIDAVAGGKWLGRGIIETAVPAETGIAVGPRRRASVPFDFPDLALNPFTIRAANTLYWRRVPQSGRQHIVAYDRFFYPLDALLQWNRLYGRLGFRQFQCVVPFADGAVALRRMIEMVGRSRNASFLAVLKRLGGEGRGCLSFPMPGYTLAVDFPRRPGTDALMASLEHITRDHGGRVYLAKDSTLSATGFATMYPKLNRYRAVLVEVDPFSRMASDMSRRLKIRAAG